MQTLIQFDDTARGKLYGALKEAFPDAKVTDADLAALAVCLRRSKASGEAMPEQLENLDITGYDQDLSRYEAELDLPPLEKSTVTRPADDAGRYYWANATHARTTPSGFSPFVGELAMARVSLPARSPAAFKTCIGQILPGDHLVDTVLEANQKYQRFLSQPIGRLDLITPARQGVRFGAISVLLGYAQPGDTIPFCYILEAGTATGQPKVLYLGKTIDAKINAYSGYQPTPFACPSHAYTGQLTLEGDDPRTLRVTSREVEGGTSKPPYIDVQVEFTLQTNDVSTIWPGFLMARAASIVLMRKLRGTITNDCAFSPPGERA